MNGYEPWQPPFKYDSSGQFITDSLNHRVLDVRGWGFLTGRGHAAKDYSMDKATRIQDNFGSEGMRVT